MKKTICVEVFCSVQFGDYVVSNTFHWVFVGEKIRLPEFNNNEFIFVGFREIEI